MIFEELKEFKKDLKNLLKKYRTLNDDLDVVKKVLDILHLLLQLINVVIICSFQAPVPEHTGQR